MKNFRIESSEGVILGAYQGKDENEAIRAMNKDAGEEDLDRNDGLIVREVEAVITSAMVKENNAGGLSIECYDQDDNIVCVIANIEMGGQKTGAEDLKGIVDGDWSYTDASDWYDREGNSHGDKKRSNSSESTVEMGEELTAADVQDNHESTEIIAEYDGKTMHIYYDDMGHAGKKYFNVEE